MGREISKLRDSKIHARGRNMHHLLEWQAFQGTKTWPWVLMGKEPKYT